MGKIIEFASEEEFIEYRKSKTFKEVGTGSEGTCYLGHDGKVYKDFTDGCTVEDYVPSEIITTSEVENESFAFPECLFVVSDRLVGLTMKHVKRDLLDKSLIDDIYLATFDFDSLLKAYAIMKKDVDKLSDEGIRVFDLNANLMFDGKRLCGVDTCGFVRVKADVHGLNQYYLDDAVKGFFCLWDESFYADNPIDASGDVVSYVRAIEKRYKGGTGEKARPYVYKK